MLAPRTIMILSIFASLFTALSAHIAAAQAVEPGTIAAAFREGQGDPLSMRFLRDIFGCRMFAPFGTVCDGAGPKAIFEVIIGPFNTFCLALGAALLSWNVFAGISQTAHEGTVLGARWSSLWAAPRVLVATAMLTPLATLDGYNTIQGVTAWVVRASTSAASDIWGMGADFIISGDAVTAKLEAQQDPTAIEALWRIMLCRHALARTLRTSQWDMHRSDLVLFEPLSSRPQVDVIEEFIAEYELPVTVDLPNSLHHVYESQIIPAPDVKGWSPGDCGSISTPRAPAEVTAQAANAFAAAHKAAIDALVPRISAATWQVVRTVRGSGSLPAGFEAEFDLPGKISSWMKLHRAALARPLDVAFDGAYGEDVERARDILSTIIAGSAATVCGNGPDDRAVRAACRTNEGQGWLMAGAYYLHLARFNGNRLAFMEAKPETHLMVPADLKAVLGQTWWNSVWAQSADRVPGGAVETGGLRGAIGREVNTSIGEGIELWNRALPSLAAQGVAVPERIIENLHGETAAAGKLFDMKRWMSEMLLSAFGPDRLSGDPIVSIMLFGNELTGWAAAAAFGAGIAGGIPVIGSVFEATGGLLFPLALAGAFLTYILPTLPSIFFVLAVTGYFLRVAEAMLAVNLWAIGHLRMDGEGLAGEGGRPGYFMFLGLAFAPILMIFAFLISMTIFKVTAVLLNHVVYIALEGVNVGQNAVAWAFGVICVLGMIVVAYAVMAERSFSLLYELPDRVLNWIGAKLDLAGEEYGYAKAGSLAVSGGTAPAVGATAKGAGRGVRASIRAGWQRWRRPERPGIRSPKSDE